eukprot:5095935-Alexandrium_andersonii.AAC.1
MLDASPKLGRELLALSEEVVEFPAVGQAPRITSRFLSFLSLANRRCAAEDKASALCYVAWREYGRSRRSLGAWL